MPFVKLKLGNLFDEPSDLVVLPCSTGGTVTNFVANHLREYHIPHPYLTGATITRCVDGAVEIRRFLLFFRIGNNYEFVHIDSVLIFKPRKLESQTLTPPFEDGFDFGGLSVVFTGDEKGDIDGFKTSSGRSCNVGLDKSSE